MIRVMSAIPGSGKTTVAERLLEEAVTSTFKRIISADQYHTKEDGTYDWKPENAGLAHDWCFMRYMRALEHVQSAIYTEPEKALIIVDNTNTQRWEASQYVSTGRYFGHEVIITRVVCDLDVCLERQTHNVPEKTIRAMQARFEEPLPFWKHETIDNNPK